MGKDEVHLVNEMIQGVAQLLHWEKELELTAAGSITGRDGDGTDGETEAGTGNGNGTDGWNTV